MDKPWKYYIKSNKLIMKGLILYNLFYMKSEKKEIYRDSK